MKRSDSITLFKHLMCKCFFLALWLFMLHYALFNLLTQRAVNLYFPTCLFAPNPWFCSTNNFGTTMTLQHKKLNLYVLPSWMEILRVERNWIILQTWKMKKSKLNYWDKVCVFLTQFSQLRMQILAYLLGSFQLTSFFNKNISILRCRYKVMCFICKILRFWKVNNLIT